MIRLCRFLFLLRDNAFGKFRSDILGVKPGGAIGTPYVCLRSINHWCIEAAQAQKNIRLVRALGNDMGTASRAKAAKFSPR
jgi:hypothetical protein